MMHGVYYPNNHHPMLQHTIKKTIARLLSTSHKFRTICHFRAQLPHGPSVIR